MKNLVHILQIPKEDYQTFLDQKIIPKLIELNVSDYPIGIYISKKGRGNNIIPTGYYIIDSKTMKPFAYLSTEGKLEFYLPQKYNKFLLDLEFLKTEREH